LRAQRHAPRATRPTPYTRAGNVRRERQRGWGSDGERGRPILDVGASALPEGIYNYHSINNLAYHSRAQAHPWRL
jgi:hypothetical protein